MSWPMRDSVSNEAVSIERLVPTVESAAVCAAGTPASVGGDGDVGAGG